MPDTPKPRKPKSTNAEIEQRVQTVLAWLLEGARTSIIVHNGSQKWNVDERQIKEYIARATQLIQAEAQERRAIGFEFAMNALLDMVKGGDKQSRVRLGAIAELNKMLGNYAPTNLNLKAEVTETREPDLSTLSYEQLYELKHGHKPT
jgi:hypothetical protein